MVKWEKYVLTPAERARRRHPERYRRNVPYEALEGLSDTMWQFAKHPSTIKDAYEVSQAVRNKQTGRDERPPKKYLRGSQGHIPMSQGSAESALTTQSLAQLQMSDYGGSSGGMSLSNIGSTSTHFGRDQKVEELQGVKLYDNRKRRRTSKPYGPSLSSLSKALNPEWRVTMKYVENDGCNSTSGSQMVLTPISPTGRLYNRTFLRGMYQKMIRELSPFSNLVASTFSPHFESDAAKTTTLFPGLTIDSHERVYNIMNTSNAVQAVDIIQWQCTQDCHALPEAWWAADLQNQEAESFVVPEVLEPKIANQAGQTIYEVGKRPNRHCKLLFKHWKIERTTKYELAAGQMIVHKVQLPIYVTCANLYTNNSGTGSVSTSGDNHEYLEYITRAFTFVTRGQPGFASGTTTADDNKIVVVPSYWNITVSDKYNFRVPIQIKHPSVSLYMAASTGMPVDTTSAVVYHTYDQTTTGSNQVLPADGGTQRTVSDQEKT